MVLCPVDEACWRHVAVTHYNVRGALGVNFEYVRDAKDTSEISEVYDRRRTPNVAWIKPCLLQLLVTLMMALAQQYEVIDPS